MIPDRPRDSQTSDSDSDGPILYRDEEEEEEEEDEDSNSMSHNYEKNSMFDNSHVSSFKRSSPKQLNFDISVSRRGVMCLRGCSTVGPGVELLPHN